MSWCRLGVSCAVSGSVGPALCSQPTLPDVLLVLDHRVQVVGVGSVVKGLNLVMLRVRQRIAAGPFQKSGP